jgi:hypothetical protein
MLQNGGLSKLKFGLIFSQNETDHTDFIEQLISHGKYLLKQFSTLRARD